MIPRISAPGTRSFRAVASAVSIALSAKSDRRRVASSKVNSPARSPSAMARATPVRRCRSSASTVSADAASAASTAAAAPRSRKVCASSGRAAAMSLRNGENSRARDRAASAARRQASNLRQFVAHSARLAKPPGRSVVQYGPWIRIVDLMVRRMSAWTVELSASIFRQHMPASLPHSGEPSLRRTTTRASGTSPSFCAG